MGLPEGVPGLERAEALLKDGYPEKSLRILQTVEKNSPGVKGLQELLSVAQVCSAFAASVRIALKSARGTCNCSTSNTPNPFVDWYLVLQVKSDADDGVIKKQYRRLVLLLHPDKNGHKKAEEAFKLVSQAYMVLSDSNQRATFNKERIHYTGTCSATVHPWGVPPATSFPPPHFNKSSFFGGAGYGRSWHATSPPAQRSPVPEAFSRPAAGTEAEQLQSMRDRARARNISFEKEWVERKEKWQKDLAEARERALARREAWERKHRAMPAAETGPKGDMSAANEMQYDASRVAETNVGVTLDPATSAEVDELREKVEDLPAHVFDTYSPRDKIVAGEADAQEWNKSESEPEVDYRNPSERETEGGTVCAQRHGGSLNSKETVSEPEEDSSVEAELGIDDGMVQGEGLKGDPASEGPLTSNVQISLQNDADLGTSIEGCTEMRECKARELNNGSRKERGVVENIGDEFAVNVTRKECSEFIHSPCEGFDCRSENQESEDDHVKHGTISSVLGTTSGKDEHGRMDRQIPSGSVPNFKQMEYAREAEENSCAERVAPSEPVSGDEDLNIQKQPDLEDSRNSDTKTTGFSRKRPGREYRGNFWSGMDGERKIGNESVERTVSCSESYREGRETPLPATNARETRMYKSRGSAIADVSTVVNDTISKHRFSRFLGSKGRPTVSNVEAAEQQGAGNGDRSRLINMQGQQGNERPIANAMEAKARTQERVLQLQQEIKAAIAQRTAQETNSKEVLARRLASGRARRESQLLRVGVKEGRSDSHVLNEMDPFGIKVGGNIAVPLRQSFSHEMDNAAVNRVEKDNDGEEAVHHADSGSMCVERGPFSEWASYIVDAVEPAVKKTKEASRPATSASKRSVLASKVPPVGGVMRSLRTRSKLTGEGRNTVTWDGNGFVRTANTLAGQIGSFSSSCNFRSKDFSSDFAYAESSGNTDGGSQSSARAGPVGAPSKADRIEGDVEKEYDPGRPQANAALDLRSAGGYNSFSNNAVPRSTLLPRGVNRFGSCTEKVRDLIQQHREEKLVEGDVNKLAANLRLAYLNEQKGRGLMTEKEIKAGLMTTACLKQDRLLGESNNSSNRQLPEGATAESIPIEETSDSMQFKQNAGCMPSRDAKSCSAYQQRRFSLHETVPSMESSRPRPPGLNCPSRSREFFSAAKAAAEAMAAASAAKAAARRVLAEPVAPPPPQAGSLE